MRVAGWLTEEDAGQTYYIPNYDVDVLTYYYRPEIESVSKSERVKAVIGEIVTRQKLRTSQILSKIGTADPPVTFDV